MQHQVSSLQSLQPGETRFGFELIRSEAVPSLHAQLYTLRHQKTGAALLYLDRPDENKTFSISFKTLPENDTGVFHILEHSVLNGSRKFSVKEPFVSLLQSSMQTFLNAMTFSDKTVFPVSSRNEQDLFNLMSVYLDGVFFPMIYERPEIFMQEGWHYEFDGTDAAPSYNGVVYSEMKGYYADVDRVIDDEMNRLLFPDTCYGYMSGGQPEHIPELTYQQFIETHKRFYHPSNARLFLDGHMDIDRFLREIDAEYLSKFDYRAPDFDFVMQAPKCAQHTVTYEARPGEEEFAHLSIAKILCTHRDVEKIYAAKVLANYLTGSNEAPLKRAFLERGLAQDVSLSVSDGIYQPSIAFVARNTTANQFDAVKAFLPEAVRTLLAQGLDKNALMASLERFVFSNKEISEPYGVELAIKALDGWLYGDDPLTHIENQAIFEDLRAKVGTDYFSGLLEEMLADPEDKSYLYVCPSLTKGQEDAQAEAQRAAAAAAAWSEQERQAAVSAFEHMQQWQQSMDSDEVLATLPHLSLADVPETVAPPETALLHLGGIDALQVAANTNGIVYLNFYFDVSDFTAEELRVLNALTSCFGELRTEHFSAQELQTRIKTVMGGLSARIEWLAKPGDLEHCRPRLLVSASALEENVPAAAALLEEILMHGRYDESGRICETLLQNDYYFKQALIGSGHMFAITKALSPFSAEAAGKELLNGESYVRWFSGFASDFQAHPDKHCAEFLSLAARAFTRGRLFLGYCGACPAAPLEALILALPEGAAGTRADHAVYSADACGIEISGDVGYSALAHNLYALDARFTGACPVLASLMTYGYLWNAVRVQGGAYGTGMSIRTNGDIFCYSYRDPNLDGSRAAFAGMADFLDAFLAENAPLDDIIIGTVNTTDPLLDPSGICDLACNRYLRGITPAAVAQTRRELLSTTSGDLAALAKTLRAYLAAGKYCAVGNRDAIAHAGSSET